MLLIGTPVKLTSDPELLEGDLPIGTEGFVNAVTFGDEFPLEVTFQAPAGQEAEGPLMFLLLGLDEVEVLAEDICYCHLMTGEMREMSVCGVCAS